MKVRIISNCKVEGVFREVGDVLDVQKETRTILRSQNQCEDLPDDFEEEISDPSASTKKLSKKEVAAAAKAAAAGDKSNTDPAP
jgi:hypothetical protein